MRCLKLLVAAAVLLAVSCGGSPASLEENENQDRSSMYPDRGVVHWSPSVGWDRFQMEEAAKSKLVIFPLDYCLSTASDQVIGELKSLNPDIKIIGYRLVLQVSQLPPDTNFVRDTYPYQLDFYNLALGHWAWTTTGDTLSGWPGLISLNPFTDGLPDEAFMVEQVGLMESYLREREYYLDGIMHDYFQYSFYIDPSSIEGEKGGIDLDGDGVIFDSDDDERENFLQWQIDFAWEIRARFGDDFIQIGNGRVPQENAELAGALNGIFYENFPNMCWSLTDHQGLLILLENQKPGYLDEAHGRTWSLLAHKNIEYNNYFCLVSSLLAGCLYTEVYGKYLFSGWRYQVNPGQPLSGLHIEGKADSIISYSRKYSGGTARLSFADYGGRIDTEFIESDR